MMCGAWILELRLIGVRAEVELIAWLRRPVGARSGTCLKSVAAAGAYSVGIALEVRSQCVFQRPMMWGDMFFRLASPTRDYYDLNSNVTQALIDSVPKGVDLVFYDYYHLGELPPEPVARARDGLALFFVPTLVCHTPLLEVFLFFVFRFLFFLFFVFFCFFHD